MRSALSMYLGQSALHPASHHSYVTDIVTFLVQCQGLSWGLHHLWQPTSQSVSQITKKTSHKVPSSVALTSNSVSPLLHPPSQHQSPPTRTTTQTQLMPANESHTSKDFMLCCRMVHAEAQGDRPAPPQAPCSYGKAASHLPRQGIHGVLLHGAVLPCQALDQLQRLIQPAGLCAHVDQHVVALVSGQHTLRARRQTLVMAPHSRVVTPSG